MLPSEDYGERRRRWGLSGPQAVSESSLLEVGLGSVPWWEIIRQAAWAGAGARAPDHTHLEP